jgi:hypothetical protein
MNISPVNNYNHVYVILEIDNSIPFVENYKVIGVAYSLETVKYYAGPNRIIKGPVPILETPVLIQPTNYNPTFTFAPPPSASIFQNYLPQDFMDTL